MKTEDEVIALAKEHGACLTKVIVFGGKVDGFAFTNINLQAFAAACAEPAVPAGWQLVPFCLTPDMRGVLLRDCGFTVGELYTMLLAAAPKRPAVPVRMHENTEPTDAFHIALVEFAASKGNPK